MPSMGGQRPEMSSSKPIYLFIDSPMKGTTSHGEGSKQNDQIKLYNISLQHFHNISITLLLFITPI